jgi:glycosyltransferase involved in cell wall biosynthesis
MACYNAVQFVGEAVESVLGQTYPNIEFIAVDDGSTDATFEILEYYARIEPRRIRLLQQANRGPYPARNHGLKQASGEFVAFLDADDWWDPHFLEHMASALVATQSDIAYCGWQNVGLSGPRANPYIPPDYEVEGKLQHFLHAAAPWPIHAALVRREALQHVGGFDIQWPTCMDYDLWLRLGLSSRLVRVSEVLAFYRHHSSGQITSTQWRQASTVWRIKGRYLRDHPDVAKQLSASQQRDLVDGALRRRAFDLYWSRDLTSAHKLFRLLLWGRVWASGDTKYLLSALLPRLAFKTLVRSMDGMPRGATGPDRP